MKKLLMILLLIPVICILSACSGQAQLPETEPTTEPEAFDISQIVFTKSKVLFQESGTSEEGLSGFGLNKDLEVAQLDGITYAFASEISLDDRAECIQATRAILEEIGLDKPVKIHVYSPSTYDETFAENGSVYIPAQDWESPGYITALLYGLFGEYCHYGALYGYANYLCRQLYGTPMELCGEDWAYEGEPAVLDLNLLCYRPEFAAEADILDACKLANTFVTEYIRQNGTESFHALLESSGDPERVDTFCDALEAFYASVGVSHTPSSVLYRMGGRTYDYIVKCEYAILYIEKTWTDMNKDMCPLTYENFLHENYRDVCHYFTTSVSEMGQYQELFGLYPYNNDLHIYYSNNAGRTSYYMAQSHSVCLQNTASLSHEFIHSLTYDANIHEYWAGEGFAQWFDSYFNHYGNAMSTVDSNKTDLPYVLEYKQNLGRDIDMSTDFVDIWHITTYAYSYDDPNDAYGYVPGASFIGYLISRFGEEKVLEIICRTHDFGEFTYEELVADWQDFIQENYSGYTKRKE